MAVVILAIIAVPIMHAFVTTMRTNGRARDIERATSAARNVMEDMKSISLDSILGDTGNVSVDATTGVITWHYSRGLTVDGTDFDAAIVLDGRTDPDNITRYNDSQIREMFNLDERTDAMYMQEQGGTGLRGLDDQMASRFGNEAEARSNMKRTITLRIEQQETGGKKRQQVFINYAYTYAGETRYANSQDQCIYDSMSVEGTLQKVYLFFEPLYNTPAVVGDNPEVIEIMNHGCVPVEVNLIRMEMNPEGVIDSREASYAVTVKAEERRNAWELLDGENQPVLKTQIRTNLSNVSNPAAGIYDQLDLRYSYADGMTPAAMVTASGGATVSAENMLGLKAEGDAAVLGENVYKMTVSIYDKEGDWDAKGDPLITLEGAKEK